MARILFVDEHEYMRMALQMAVSDKHSAETASSSEEALQLVGSSQFDIAAIDIHTTGLDLIAHLQRISPGIAVLAVLDAGRIRTAIEAMSRGAIFYLFKPFDLNNLMDIINAIADRPAALKRDGQSDENSALRSSVKIGVDSLHLHYHSTRAEMVPMVIALLNGFGKAFSI